MANLDLQIRLKAFDNANAPLRKLIQTSRDLQASLQKSGVSLDKLTRLKAQADGFEPLRQQTRALGESIKPLQARMNSLNDTLVRQRERQTGLNQTIAAGEKAYKQYDRDIERINRTLARIDERKKTDPGQKAALRAKRDRLLAEQGMEKESLARLAALRERYGRFVERNAAQLSALERQLGETRQNYHAMRDTLIRHRQALRQGGYDVRDMGSTQRRLGQDVERTTRALERQQRALSMRQNLAQKMGAFRQSAHTARVMSEHGAFVGGGMIMAGQHILGGFARLGQGARGFVDTAQMFEKYQTILKTTEGSAQAAEKSMQWISEFAVKTPYELDETTDAFVRLRAYGLDPTSGLLKTLGDTSAAMGKPLMQSVEAIADAITGENERLKEFGIKASKKGGMITYTYTDREGIQQMAQAAANNRKQIEETLSRIWSEKYGGAMGDLATTFGGTVANLGDQWKRFQKMVMDSGVFAVITERIKGLLATLDKMAANGEMQRWAQDLADIMVALFETLWETGRAIASLVKTVAPWIRANKDLVVWAGKWLFFAGVLLSVFGPLYIGFSFMAAGGIKLVAALKLLASGFTLLARSMLANPIVLAITAVVAVGWLLYQNWDKITAYLRERWEALKMWWDNTPIGQKIMDVFTAPIRFLASLAGLFFNLLAEAGRQVIVAIFGWDVYNTLVSVFSGGIEWVMTKLDALSEKVRGVKQAFKELLGLEEGSLLANDPKPTFGERNAAHIRYQENKAEIDAKREAVIKSMNGGLSPQSVEAIKARVTPPLTANDLIQKIRQAKPAEAVKKSAQTITIENKVDVNVNAEGVGLKEVAGMITREVTQGIHTINRDLAARQRAALYDAHA